MAYAHSPSGHVDTPELVSSLFGAALLFVRHSGLYCDDKMPGRTLNAAFSVMAVWGASKCVRDVRNGHVRQAVCLVADAIGRRDPRLQQDNLLDLYQSMPFTNPTRKPTTLARRSFAVRIFEHDWDQLDKQSAHFKRLVVICAERHCLRIGAYTKRHLNRYLPKAYRGQCTPADAVQTIGAQLADVIAPGEPSVSRNRCSTCCVGACNQPIRIVASDSLVALFRDMCPLSKRPDRNPHL